MIEMMKTQSDKNKIIGPSNLTKRPAEIQQQSSKIKVTKFKMVPILRLLVLAALSGSMPNEDQSDNLNVSRDVNPTTNVEEMDGDDREDDNLSCLENEIINEDNSSNVDSVLGLDNDKTYNIFRTGK